MFPKDKVCKTVKIMFESINIIADGLEVPAVGGDDGEQTLEAFLAAQQILPQLLGIVLRQMVIVLQLFEFSLEK